MWWKWEKSGQPRPSSIGPIRSYLEGLEQARRLKIGKGADNQNWKRHGKR